MGDKDQGKILGFTKREAEILIMSLQVIKPNRCVTNGCTAKPSDLVSIGAYESTETARTEYAALRARVMTLPNLRKGSATQLGFGAEDLKDSLDPLGNKDNKDERNPFLLTEEEMRQAAIRAGNDPEGDEYEIAFNKYKLGEGVVDDDVPNEAEWEAMGDRKTI